jgi:hypothetical protein
LIQRAGECNGGGTLYGSTLLVRHTEPRAWPVNRFDLRDLTSIAQYARGRGVREGTTTAASQRITVQIVTQQD